MTSREELRLIWGYDLEANLDRVTDAYDSLGPKARAVFDAGGVSEFLALEALSGPAYRDEAHPGHADASRRVAAFHKLVAGNDEIVQ